MLSDPSTYAAFSDRLFFEPNCGCWLWGGAWTGAGYGHFRGERAHRVSYRHFKGEIPEGAHIHHRCEVRCCVNPEHLEAVSPGIHTTITLDSRRKRRKAVASSVKITSVEQVIDACGGAEAIGAHMQVSAWAVYKWKDIGIHDRHWKLIMSLCEVTIHDLYKINEVFADARHASRSAEVS